MRLQFIILILFTCFAQEAFSQMEEKYPKPPSTEEEFEKQYNRRIKKDILHGVYIPKDMADAFIQLNKLVDKDSKAKFKTMSEVDAAEKLYFSFGRWIVHNWGFYGGSRFSHYIKSVGIHHPEEMAKFTIVMYHRYLNKKKLEVKSYVEAHQAAKEKKLEEQKKDSKVIETFKRKRKKEE